MAIEFTIGSRDVDKALRALEAATGRHLRSDLNDAAVAALKPLIPKTRAVARRTLPSAGGLAGKVASAPQKVETGRQGSPAAGARLVLRTPRGTGAKGANRGRVRHPVFGNANRWVTQTVPGGWFDKTAKGETDAIKRRLEQGVLKTLERIAREGN